MFSDTIWNWFLCMRWYRSYISLFKTWILQFSTGHLLKRLFFNLFIIHQVSKCFGSAYKINIVLCSSISLVWNQCYTVIIVLKQILKSGRANSSSCLCSFKHVLLIFGTFIWILAQVYTVLQTCTQLTCTFTHKNNKDCFAT